MSTAFETLKPTSKTKNGPQQGTFSHTTEGHRVEIYGKAWLPTRYGEFNIYAFKNDKDDKDHIALVKGEIQDQIGVPTRLHSECLTGDVFTSLKCDCRQQLEKALESLGNNDHGILVYMRQEGRGIGLANKIRAYALQEEGLDTVEANEHLGFDDDMREYDVAAEMIKLLGVKSIALLTNNPSKMEGLRNSGIEIEERKPIVMPPNEHNLFYLQTKNKKSGHFLDSL